MAVELKKKFVLPLTFALFLLSNIIVPCYALTGQELWHELLYGEGKWLGIIILLVLIILACRINSYAGILFMPITIFLALDYFKKIPSDSNFLWAAIVMLFTSIFMLLPIIQKAKK